jgi:hypothetical protein
MKTNLDSVRPIVVLTAAAVFLSAGAGCVSTGTDAVRSAPQTSTVRSPGPHNVVVIVDTDPQGSLTANSWPAIPPTLTITLPNTETAYKKDSSGHYTGLEDSVAGPGPHNKQNVVLVRMAAPNNGETPLSSPPEVFLHVGSSGPMGDVYKPRDKPFVILNLPENFTQGTADHPMPHPVPRQN